MRQITKRQGMERQQKNMTGISWLLLSRSRSGMLLSCRSLLLCLRSALSFCPMRRSVFLPLLFVFFASAAPALASTTGIPLGSAPGDIAINPYTNTAVVTTQTGAEIVDLNTQSVISTVPITGAQHVAIDTGLNIALVTDSNNYISIIDLGSSSVISKTAFSQTISGIAVNPTNHTAVLLSNTSNGNYAIIWDIQSRAIIASVPIKGGAVKAVAVDPGLGLAIVVGQKNITAIDLTSGQVVRQLTSGTNQLAVSINPETHLAVIADKGSDTLTVLNLQTWQSSFVSVPKHPAYVAVNQLDNQALVISVPDQSSTGIVMSLVDLSAGSPPSNPIILQSYALNSLTKGVAVNNFTNIAGVIDDKTDSLNLIQLPNPVPVLNSLNPATLFRGGNGQAIAVSGSGFIETTTASIQDGQGNSYPVTPVFMDNHDMSLPAPVAALANTGSVQVTVTNPAPGGGISNTSSLRVINPVPSISSLVPLDVTAGGQSQELDVLGTGFFGDTTFFVNGTQWPSNYDSYLKAHLAFSVPELAYGRYYDIGAFNPLPGGGNSNTMRFTVLNPLPLVNGLVPDSTLYETAASLIVNGAGFVPTSQVQFNGTPLPFTYSNRNTLSVNIPANLVNNVGNYGLNVINPAPGGGTSNVMNLAVLPRQITITPDNKTITYGAPAPTFTYTITSGAFVNGDSLGTPVYTFNGSTTVPTQAGTYVVGITGLSNPNYAITNATGVFTINKAAAICNVTGYSVTYDGAAHTASGSCTGVLGENLSASLALTGTTHTNAGDYPSDSWSFSGGANYIDAMGTVHDSIAQAPVTITLGNLSQTYDGAPEPVTVTASPSASYSVIYNGIAPAVYNASSTAPTQPGSYAVTVTVTDPNYTGSTTGTLTINQLNPNLSLALQSGSPEPSPYGTRMYFELSTASSAANSIIPCPTGTVSFYIDGGGQPSTVITLGSATRPDCTVPVEFSTDALTAGTHSINAVYSGDTYYQGATSNSVSHAVSPDGTAVTLATSGTTVNVGDPITLTATVMPAPVNGGFVQAPAGSVQFNQVDGQGNLISTLGTGALSNTTAVFSTSTLPAGTYDIQAIFTDTNGEFQGSSSLVSLTTVELRTPVITWTPNVSSIVYGTPLSGDQLNALAADPETGAAVSGTFSYIPAAGSIQGVGNPNLQVTFTPTDGTVYNSNSATTTITVTPATLTVTADNQTMTYGGSMPQLTFQYSGFINGDGPSGVTTAPTCSTAAISLSSVGTYDITCSGGSASNYSINYVKGTLTIIPAPITVTPDNKTITYGDPSPAFTYSVTSGAIFNGDSLGTLAYTFNGASAVPTAAGTYTIAIAGPSNPNYAVTSATGTFTITQKQASVTPNAASKTYGQTDPLLTGTLSGFIASDNVTANYTRTPGENAGTYAITAVLSPAAVLPNYSLIYNAATFTINNPAPVLGSLTPSTISPNTATTVIINGTGFVPSSNASFDGAGIATVGDIQTGPKTDILGQGGYRLWADHGVVFPV